jgi:hypothetical protein
MKTTASNIQPMIAINLIWNSSLKLIARGW